MTPLEAITHLIDEKKRNRQIPHCAMLEDVVRLCNLPAPELKEELEKLKKEGVIARKQTINSWSIYIV
ncbi:MAG: hypothetical protein EOM07_13270 [Clostridia bacterium]|nr:hypothetical protein [Clostridia bacterium]